MSKNHSKTITNARKTQRHIWDGHLVVVVVVVVEVVVVVVVGVPHPRDYTLLKMENKGKGWGSSSVLRKLNREATTRGMCVL